MSEFRIAVPFTKELKYGINGNIGNCYYGNNSYFGSLSTINLILRSLLGFFDCDWLKLLTFIILRKHPLFHYMCLFKLL